MLKEDWLLDKHIDLEYKQYIVLDYIQKIDELMSQKKLQPLLTDLGDRLYDLIVFSGKLQDIKKNRRDKEVVALDFYNKRLVYNEKNEKTITELESIINYALPKLFFKFDELAQLHDKLLDSLRVSHVGLFIPGSPDNGYFFAQNGANEALLYEYTRYHLLDRFGDDFISLKFCERYSEDVLDYEKFRRQHIANSIENTKNYILITSEDTLPVDEALIPLCKKKIIREFYFHSSNL